MKKIKSINVLILASLLIIETFVWTVVSPISAWSGNAGQPPAKSGTPAAPATGQSNPDQADQQGGNPAQTGSEKGEPGDAQSRLIEEAEHRGLLILVNKTHSLSADYKPQDLEPIKYYAQDRTETSRYMRAEAAEAFHRLVEAGARENIGLVMTTAYRSYNFQKILYDNYVVQQGQEAADKFSAKPGQSEHQTGLAVDVTSPSVDNQLTSQFGETAEGKWLAENAHVYGFIIRFPEGKENITGYMYEPWHIRYVGVQAAGEIKKQGVTLEEYLEKIVKTI